MGGVYLEYLVLTLIGGSILFIIFLLLPIKIALSQKVLFVALAILFSHIFLWLQSVLAVWQAGLILMLLILTTALGVTKFIFMNKKAMTEASPSIDEIEKIPLENNQDLFSAIQTVNEETTNIEEVLEKTLPENYEAAPTNKEETMDGELVEEEETLAEELVQLHDLGEDIEEREPNDSEEAGDVPSETEEVDEGREVLLNEEVQEHHEEKEVNEAPEVLLDEDEVVEGLLDHQEEGQVNEEVQDIQEEEPVPVEEELERQPVSEVLCETEPILEEVEEDKPIAHEEEKVGEILELQENEGDFTENKEVMQVTNLVRKQLNRDLMDTLVGQLLWYKEQIHPQDFEHLVLDHAKEDLHDNDYYLFASILRDHYIETEQFDKLKKLLNKLKQRYNNKMVIKEEITFFENKFFQS